LPLAVGHRPSAAAPRIERRWHLGNECGNCGELRLFSLDVPDAERRHLASLLSADEMAQAARFVDPRHGERYVVAHGRLRQLLAEALGLAPETIEFAAGPHGKPELADAAVNSALQFNLSHSGDLGLVGWSRHGHIGVDVEVWRAMRDAGALVRRFFSAVEIRTWEALPAAAREEAFFNLWTRKEAYIKALGRGLSLALDSFDVSHDTGAGACLLRPSRLAADGRTWSLTAPAAGHGISLAVVLETGVCHTSP
jgi:4'-phosphopantetheinyl transferase